MPVLPDKSKRNILITSALPYVNNVPHLGNIIGCVLSADVQARYCRARGYNVIYICGTDEYGTATETKALKEGVSPKEICDKFHALHAEVYRWFNIGFDHFGRTSTEYQTKIAQDIFKRVRSHDATLERTVPQLYCAECDRFLSDRFVEGECPHCQYPDARGDQCDRCQKLLTPAELRKPRCAVLRSRTAGAPAKPCGATPSKRDSEHVYLDLPKLAPRLEHWVSETQSSGGLWSANTVSVTDSWLRGGLLPRAITRDLRWGTPVPEEKFKDKVFYVWFDAPIGYISITAEYAPDDWEKWWKTGSNNPESEQSRLTAATAAESGKEGETAGATPSPLDVELMQFMGKDNIPFHTVIFPSTLLAANDNYTMVRTVSTTEYLNYEDAKFSKSLGVGVFGDQARETGVPSFIWRYYLLAVRPESSDASFSWDDFQTRCNSELLANFGNFANRVLKFTAMHFDSKVPDYSEELSVAMRNVLSEKSVLDAAGAGRGGEAESHPVADSSSSDAFLAPFLDTMRAISVSSASYINALEHQQLREGLQLAMACSKRGNQFLQTTQPWDLLDRSAKANAAGDQKEADQLRSQCADVLAFGVNVVYHCAALLEPYTPSLVEALHGQLGLDRRVDPLFEPLPIKEQFDPFTISPGQTLGAIEPLVRKLSKAEIDNFRERFSGSQAAPGETPYPLDLRVGLVESVEPHPQSEAQYVLQVRVGVSEQRQLVSGIRRCYPDSAALVGKLVVVVCNLKPSKFKGVQSNGMILAADAGDGVFGLCTLDESAPAAARVPGSRVLPQGAAFSQKAAGARFDVKKRWQTLGLVTGPDHIASGFADVKPPAPASKKKKAKNVAADGDTSSSTTSAAAAAGDSTPGSSETESIVALQVYLGPDLDAANVIVDTTAKNVPVGAPIK